MKESGLKRIGFFEGLRGFLAIWVLFAHTGHFIGLSHFEPTDPWYPGIVPKLLVYFDLSGWDAVNLFMALSGFVISYLIDQGREGYIPYIIRRFFRLWPVFIVCVVGGVLTNSFYGDYLRTNPWTHNWWIRSQLDIVDTVQQNMLPYIFFHFLMLHGMIPVWILPKAGAAFSALAWCISTEWQFYLAAPLLFRGMKARVGKLIIWLLMLTIVIFPQIFDFSVNPASSLLPLQLHWFFLGLISYLFYCEVQTEGLNWKHIVPAILFVTAVTIFKPRHGVAGWLWLVIFAALLENALGRPSTISKLMKRVFENRVSRYFGEISYPIYLLHWPVSILLLKGLLSFPNLSWFQAYLVLLVGVPALTWPLAHFAHFLLEAPCMELGRKWAKSISSPKAIVVSGASAAESAKSQPIGNS